MEPTRDPLPDDEPLLSMRVPRDAPSTPAPDAPPLAPPVATFDFPAERRKLAQPLLRLIVRNNPAYLISAAMMIAGVYTILQPRDQSLGKLSAILATFSTFQVYEFLLVGIALFLVCVRRVMDDGATLVLIEMLFVVGSFMIVDEITFREGGIALGMTLALIAAVLAAVRFGLLGRVMGRKLPLSFVGLFVLALLAWNALTPASLARMHDAALPTAGAAYHAGWWVLSAIALGLAIVAQRERGCLWLRGEAFLSSPLARWAVAGIVLVGSAVHQYSIGYVLDRQFLLSDVIPLATFACFGAAALLAKTRGRAAHAVHVVAAAPVLLCALSVLTVQFEPMVGGPGRVLPAYSLHVHELRTLTWPTAWLWVAALLTLVQARRSRSAALAHQGAAVAVLGALFLTALLPGDIHLSLLACRMVLAAYCLIGAVVYRSPSFTAGFLLIVNYDVWRALYELPAESQLISPHVVAMAAVGASCFALWWVFRETVPAWVAHVGSGLMLAAVGIAHFSAATQLPTWVLAAAAFGLGGLLALSARRFGWWSYYGLSALSVTFSPARAVHRSEPSLGSSEGWLLVLGAFLALGIGVLISTRKMPGEEGRAT